MVKLSRALLVWLAVIALVIAYFALRPLRHYAPMIRVANDSLYIRWYTQGAKCLGLAVPYDPSIRYFTGTHLPVDWIASVSDKTQAHTDLASRSLLLDPYYALDSAVVLHEQVHLMLHDARHPQAYFNAATAARCGLTPGHD